MQQNCIEKIDHLEHLKELDTINIRSVRDENCSTQSFGLFFERVWPGVCSEVGRAAKNGGDCMSDPAANRKQVKREIIARLASWRSFILKHRVRH